MAAMAWGEMAPRIHSPIDWWQSLQLVQSFLNEGHRNMYSHSLKMFSLYRKAEHEREWVGSGRLTSRKQSFTLPR